MEEVREKRMEMSEVDNLLWNTTRLLMKTRENILAEFGFTYLQFEILEAIYQISKKNRAVIQIALSEQTQINPMTTSTILRNLQKRGLIERKRGLKNTRTVEVNLTPKGESVYHQAQKKVSKMREKVYSDVDLLQLAGQLSGLSDRLQKANKINYEN